MVLASVGGRSRQCHFLSYWELVVSFSFFQSPVYWGEWISYSSDRSLPRSLSWHSRSGLFCPLFGEILFFSWYLVMDLALTIWLQGWKWKVSSHFKVEERISLLIYSARLGSFWWIRDQRIVLVSTAKKSFYWDEAGPDIIFPEIPRLAKEKGFTSIIWKAKSRWTWSDIAIKSLRKSRFRVSKLFFLFAHTTRFHSHSLTPCGREEKLGQKCQGESERERRPVHVSALNLWASAAPTKIKIHIFVTFIPLIVVLRFQVDLPSTRVTQDGTSTIAFYCIFECFKRHH